METSLNIKQGKKIKSSQLLARRTILLFIRFYQRYLSRFLGQNCRFYPTCSQYYALAVQKYGSAKGTLLFFKRVLRCHPFSKGGVDFP